MSYDAQIKTIPSSTKQGGPHAMAMCEQWGTAGHVTHLMEYTHFSTQKSYKY